MYNGVFKIFGGYWKAYGGMRALAASPYLHAAVLLTIATFNIWTAKDWWGEVISVMPNLLGFTLGGFAIFIGFGDERFRQLLAEPEEDEQGNNVPTIYESLCATFVHFIIIQLLALIYAFIAKAWWFYLPWVSCVADVIDVTRPIFWAVGYCLFMYALTSVLAATMHVFRIATMYKQYQRAIADSSGEKSL